MSQRLNFEGLELLATLHREGRVRAGTCDHADDVTSAMPLAAILGVPAQREPEAAGQRAAAARLVTPPTADLTMTHTPLVTRVDHHVQDVAVALDLASTALIRAQELADQDTTGAAPARLAEATATLQGNVRMLADILKPLSPGAPASCAPSHDHRQRGPIVARADSTHPPAHGAHAGTPGPEAPHGET